MPDKNRITEERNPKSQNIDKMDTGEILKVINDEDARIAGAVRKEIPVISKAIDSIFKGMKQGGRLFYVGAGTSGRLGILDAVECTPTFSTDPDRIIGIMAGGDKAMFRAREGIEDNRELGAEDINRYQIKDIDSIVGIAASGKTPYVLGAVERASSLGALTVGLACNKNTSLEQICNITIAPVVGPEVLSGSTRMKAGTAQKMVLNMISTTVMIKLGKVYSNLMIDLHASNEKLKDRAERIFITITDTGPDIARKYLEKADYRVKEAIVMYERGCSQKKAEELLAKNDGILRKIIG